MKFKINVSLVKASILAFTLAACGCSRKNEPLGPIMKSATSNFTIVDSLEANYFDGLTFKENTISFATVKTVTEKVNGKDTTYKALIPHKTYFTAKFNEEVRWEIKAVQKLGGIEAVKTLSGLSSFIDSTNSSWFGESDGLRFFEQDSSLSVKLTIFGSDVMQTKIVKLAYTTGYSADSTIVLNDFEGSYDLTTYGDASDKVPYPAPDVFKGIIAPQGFASLLVSGTDYNGDYFVGGYQQPITKGLFGTHSPSDIYINMYIYGFDESAQLTPKATKFNISVSEDDYSDNGKNDPTYEDTFEKQITVDWIGWKLVSIRYQDLIRSTSRDNGGNGNNKLEPSKATAVSANLIASPNGSKVGAAIDYVVVTFGRPYEK